MSRIMTFSILFAVLIIAFLLVRMSKDMYRIFPVEEKISFEQTYDQWFDFNAPSGTFAARFPLLPQHAREKINDPTTRELREYNMYVSEQLNGTIYMISLIKFPNSNTTPSENLLRDVMEDMVKANVNNRLGTVESGQYQGYPSREFIIRNDKVETDTKAFVKDKTLFVLSRISKLEDANTEDFKYFVNSFQVLP